MVKTTRRKLKAIKQQKSESDTKSKLQKRIKKHLIKNNNLKVVDSTINPNQSNFNTRSSSKVLKRMKFTLKKLNLDEHKIIETLKNIKEQNKALNEKLENKIYQNIYVYINFKNPIEKNFRNKLFKLPYSIINKTNRLKIMLISNDIKHDSLFNDELINYNNSTNITMTTNNIEEYLDCINEEQFINMVKQVKYKDNLNYLYRMLISDNKFNFKLQKSLTKSAYRKFDVLNLNINNSQNGRSYLKTILKNVYSGGLMKKITNNLFSMKVANCAMTLEEIFKNVKVEIYKIVSEVLEKSEKHNKY